MTPYAAEPPQRPRAASAAAWCLPAPLRLQRDGVLTVCDPIYPLELTVPPSLIEPVGLLIAWFTARPVMAAETLAALTPAECAALTWLHDAGLLLPTMRGTLDLGCVPAAIGHSAFVMRGIDHHTDIIWYS